MYIATVPHAYMSIINTIDALLIILYAEAIVPAVASYILQTVYLVIIHCFYLLYI